MKKSFLSAEWRKLVIVNYKVPPEILTEHIPAQTELDLFHGDCYLSLVGFMFLNTKVKGISIPLHTNFEEVNLRFYVRRYDKSSDKIRRGVVFIKEIVPRFAISLIANMIYDENYATAEMQHEWKILDDSLEIKYSWKFDHWNHIYIRTSIKDSPMPAGSEEEFIAEHYWGYTKVSENQTSEYEVSHPRWNVYEKKSYELSVDFESVYGKEFGFLNNQQPSSVFLAEGSEIKVYNVKKLMPGD